MFYLQGKWRFFHQPLHFRLNRPFAHSKKGIIKPPSTRKQQTPIARNTLSEIMSFESLVVLTLMFFSASFPGRGRSYDGGSRAANNTFQKKTRTLNVIMSMPALTPAPGPPTKVELVHNVHHANDKAY